MKARRPIKNIYAGKGIEIFCKWKEILPTIKFTGKNYYYMNVKEKSL